MERKWNAKTEEKKTKLKSRKHSEPTGTGKQNTVTLHTHRTHWDTALQNGKFVFLVRFLLVCMALLFVPLEKRFE